MFDNKLMPQIVDAFKVRKDSVGVANDIFYCEEKIVASKKGEPATLTTGIKKKRKRTEGKIGGGKLFLRAASCYFFPCSKIAKCFHKESFLFFSCPALEVTTALFKDKAVRRADLSFFY